jgi:hypothetical protein
MVLQARRCHAPPAVVHADAVAAELQSFDQPDERAVVELERVRDVAAFAQHAHVVEPPPRALDPHQRVASADLVGAAREHVDVEVVRGRRRGRHSGRQEHGAREQPPSHRPSSSVCD